MEKWCVGEFVEDSSQSIFDSMNHLIRVEKTPIVYRCKRPKILREQYLIGRLLGEGSYAHVKECFDIKERRRFAVKIISLRHVRKKIPGGLANVDREVTVMKTLNHVNVIQLIEDFTLTDREKRYLVLAFCLGSVHDLQAKGLPLDSNEFRRMCETQAHRYFVQLIEGVSYLHLNRIIHKDLKPGNLLLTRDHVLKITDFGTCEKLEIDSTEDLIRSSQATPAIQPPEVARGDVEYFSGFKLDIYCCGVCLFFMLAGRVPFRDANVLRIYERICTGNYEMPHDCSDNASHLLRQLLALNPEARPNLKDIRSSVWWDEPECGGIWIPLEIAFNLISDEDAVIAAEESLTEDGVGRISQEVVQQGVDFTIDNCSEKQICSHNIDDITSAQQCYSLAGADTVSCSNMENGTETTERPSGKKHSNISKRTRRREDMHTKSDDTSTNKVKCGLL